MHKDPEYASRLFNFNEKLLIDHTCLRMLVNVINPELSKEWDQKDKNSKLSVPFLIGISNQSLIDKNLPLSYINSMLAAELARKECSEFSKKINVKYDEKMKI